MGIRWVGAMVLLAGCTGSTSAVPSKGDGRNGGTASSPIDQTAPAATSAAVAQPSTASTLDYGKPVLYWTENNLVRAGTLDGTSTFTIATGKYPTGVAVDIAASKIYWADNETDTITRANLDGSGAEVIYTSTSEWANPNGIALDHAANRIFWTEFSDPNPPPAGVVKTAALDGSGARVLYTGAFPTGVFANAPDLYVTDNGTDTIARGDYDGGPLVVLDREPDAFSNPTAVVAAAGFVFWSQAGSVYRMLPDGSAKTQVSAAGYADSVALDPTGPNLFFTDNASDTITRVGYDGASPTVIYRSADPFSNPRGLAAFPGSAKAATP